MSAHEMGSMGPSRRDFLSAAAMAAAAGVVYGAGGPDDHEKDKQLELAKQQAFEAERKDRKNQQIITWSEANAAVHAFYQQYLINFPPEYLTGVALLTWDQGPKEKFIEVRYSKEKPSVPEHFDYHNPNEPDLGKTEKVRVRTRERAFLRPTVMAGDSAKGQGVIGNGGTAGWIIRYNDENVCISAMHVLCWKYNLTPIGTNVFLAGAANANAKVRSFMPISWDPSTFNLWDIGMAEFNSGNDIASATMKPCPSGNTWQYPKRLSVNPTAQFTYKKMGAGTPACQRGYLNGFGMSATLFDNGKIGYFDGQMLLSSMSSNGDSGALLIWENDPTTGGTAAGIIYCGDSGETVACPLFAAPIVYKNDFTLQSGHVIPRYESAATPPIPAPRCWI